MADAAPAYDHSDLEGVREQLELRLALEMSAAD